MAHAVETMAWANEVPWHGLGTRVAPDLTPAEMCRAAGLDWTVSLRPMYMDSMVRDERGILSPGRTRIKGKFALARDTDDTVFCTTGDRWKPVQNEKAFEFFKKFTEAGHATMETAGSLHGGKMVWGLANLRAAFKLPGGDVVKGYILLVSPHEAGRAVIAKVTPVRVVCANTMAMAMSDNSKFESRFSHVREFDPALAAETLGAAREQIRDFERNAHVLKRLNLSSDDVVRILAPTFQPAKKDEELKPEDLVRDRAKLNKPMQQLMKALTDAPGADPDTGWGALNAVTYHLDHSYGKSRDQRLFHSWLAVGASQKQEVFHRLLEMAE